MGIARKVEKGIISAEEAKRQILDKGKKKYSAKKEQMIKSFKEAESTAKSRFALLCVDDVARTYSMMWDTMKTNYEEAMEKAVEDIWVREFGKAMGLAPAAPPTPPVAPPPPPAPAPARPRRRRR